MSVKYVNKYINKVLKALQEYPDSDVFMPNGITDEIKIMVVEEVLSDPKVVKKILNDKKAMQSLCKSHYDLLQNIHIGEIDHPDIDQNDKQSDGDSVQPGNAEEDTNSQIFSFETTPSDVHYAAVEYNFD